MLYCMFLNCNCCVLCHSFIHYGDLYSAPSRLLLRSAPDPCTAKEKSFEARVKCVRKNPGEQSLRQRKPIPHRGTNHNVCVMLVYPSVFGIYIAPLQGN